MNLALFRLATCCGLRASELCHLRLRDVRLGIDRPHLDLPGAICKNGRARKVPLWWDQATHDDLLEHIAWRQGNEYVVGPVRSDAARACLTRVTARRRYVRITRDAIGREHTIHDGRHTFVSHALQASRSPAEVMGATGHQDLSVLSRYTHIAVADTTFGNMFHVEQPAA